MLTYAKYALISVHNVLNAVSSCQSLGLATTLYFPILCESLSKICKRMWTHMKTYVRLHAHMQTFVQIPLHMSTCVYTYSHAFLMPCRGSPFLIANIFFLTHPKSRDPSSFSQHVSVPAPDLQTYAWFKMLDMRSWAKGEETATR